MGRQHDDQRKETCPFAGHRRAGTDRRYVRVKSWQVSGQLSDAKRKLRKAKQAGCVVDCLHFDNKIARLKRPYQQLRPGSLRPYNHYLGRLEHHIGVRRVDSIDGIDIRRWHKDWSSGGQHLAAASMVRVVLEAAVGFGVMMRLKGCADLLVTIQAARRKLPAPRPRTAVITSDQVTAAREAAHARGRASSALPYAFAYETTLRLWDVIGQWWPMDMGGMSDVLDPDRKMKWFGLR